MVVMVCKKCIKEGVQYEDIVCPNCGCVEKVAFDTETNKVL